MRIKKDLEKESNNLSIIVVLSLFLICSLGYIAYDKYFINIPVSKPIEKESSNENNCNITYNKDGIYIKKLLQKVVIHGYAIQELYLKEKVNALELGEKYRNELIINNIGKSSFSSDELKNSSIEILGKNLYESIPGEITVLCDTSYGITNSETYIKSNTGGCDGTTIQELEVIDRVEADNNHIYIYNRVGFRCSKGVCTGIHQGTNEYTFDNVIKEIETSNPTDYYKATIDLNEIKDKLDIYKFTFTYDETNNNYYFESVEKEN